ncbi:MAG TPA: phospholipase D-like domain-containing protein, partial [Polyangiaceae bacterium]|nr:phospholipase D-like domain-containing protein [Polyangiaceae bacterium]
YELVSIGIQMERSTEKLDSRDYSCGSVPDSPLLAELSHQTGNLRAQDAHHRTEQSRAACHRYTQLVVCAQHPLSQGNAGQDSVHQVCCGLTCAPRAARRAHAAKLARESHEHRCLAASAVGTRKAPSQDPAAQVLLELLGDVPWQRSHVRFACHRKERLESSSHDPNQYGVLGLGYWQPCCIIMVMVNSKPPHEVETSLYKLVFHPISDEEPSSVFADAAQDVSRDATELCIVGPYLGGAVLLPLVEGRKFRLITDLEACFGAGVDEAVLSLLSDHLDSIKNKAGVHAKLVCSSKAALFGSANFTRQGFASRDELGCLIRDPQLLLIVQQWFEDLWLTSDAVDEKALSSVAKQVKERAVARQELGIATENPPDALAHGTWDG